RRLIIARHALPSGRYLLEMRPAGHYLDDDEQDALAGALGSGQSSFRFETKAAQANPALALLNANLERLDAGMAQFRAILAGQADGAADPGLPLAAEGQRVLDMVEALIDRQREADDVRQGLEARLAAVKTLLGQFETRAAALEAAAENGQ